MQRWKSHFNPNKEVQHYKFNCYRCKTKNTHAYVNGSIISYLCDSASNDKEEFKFLHCSTCGAYSIEYSYYKVIEKVAPTKNGEPIKRIEHKLKKRLYFPFSFSEFEVQPLIRKDYNLMHSCFQIGSAQGVSVHCRRILDKIFTEFEKKYLTEEEKFKKIDKRVKLISEKSSYFATINETIKNLKGVVSTIIHKPEDDLEVHKDLEINENNFNEIKDIIHALLQIYDLEFNTLENLKEKYVKAKSI